MEYGHDNRNIHGPSCSPAFHFPPLFFPSPSPSPSLSVFRVLESHQKIPTSPIMGRTGTSLPGFCLNRVAARARVRSPPIEPRPISASAEADHPPPEPSENSKENSGGVEKQGAALGRRIMIVVESSPEARGALQWALSHTVQSQDTFVLLDVVKPSKHGDKSRRECPKDYELLDAMKNICQSKRPEVQVELSLVEGKERGPTIVEEARKQGASLLVLGQKKRSITWRMLMMWSGNRIGGGVVDYCVQNSTCMTLAVRRKSRRAGGYLITTRRHRDFWLLA